MTAELAVLERLLWRAACWTRCQRALHGAGWGLAAGGTAWALWASPTLLLALPSAGALMGLGWPLARARLARALDESDRLEGRLSAAVELLPKARRSPFEDAALRDAARHAAHVSLQRALPWRWPSARLSLAWLLSAGLALLAAAPEPVPSSASAPSLVAMAPEARPLLERDELEALRDTPLHTLTDAALRAQLVEYESLLAAVESALPPATLIARALSLESQLAATGELSSERDRAALRALASELQRASPGLAQALRGDLAGAARELRQLGSQLRAESVTAREKQLLAAALAQARKREHERLAALARESELDGLLKRTERAARDSAEPSLLKRRREQQRELETLRRERAQPLSRELQKLSRELSLAGDALAQEGAEPEQRAEQQQQQRAGEAMQQAGDALERFQQREHSARQERALSQAVAQLRELLQRRALAQRGERERAQAGDAGDSAQTSASERRQRFSERARGERADAEGARGEAAGGEPGRATSGAQTEGAGSATMVAVQTRQLQQLESVERVGEAGGAEHDPTRGAASTRSPVQYQDASLRGVESKGPVRSQVIRGAASGGFASLGYRKVYADYREHAEALLEQTEVPAGARFHVRRYFELVRPRALDRQNRQDPHD